MKVMKKPPKMIEATSKSEDKIPDLSFTESENSDNESLELKDTSNSDESDKPPGLIVVSDSSRSDNKPPRLTDTNDSSDNGPFNYSNHSSDSNEPPSLVYNSGEKTYFAEK
jgi:hypothetical protein